MSVTEDVARVIGQSLTPPTRVGSEFADQIARSSLGDVALRHSARIAGASTKIASKIYDEDAASGKYYTRLDIAGKNVHKIDGISPQVLVPGRYQRDAELFIGPFMQLGTYLGLDKTDPMLSLAVDVIVDPVNLVGLGAGLLTKAGKASRLITALTDGMNNMISVGRAGALGEGAITGVTVVDKAIDVLDKVGRVTGQSRDKLLTLARSNRFNLKAKREFNSILREAMDSNELDDGVRSVIEILKKDRQSLGTVMDIANKYGDDLMPDEAFLRKRLVDRMRAGQASLPVYLEKPFAGTKAILGVPYKQRILWAPMAGHFAPGLEHVHKGLAKVSGRSALKGVPENQLDAALEAERSVYEAMERTMSDMTDVDFYRLGQYAKMITGIKPGISMQETAIADIQRNPEVLQFLQDAFERATGQRANTKNNAERFERFIDMVLEDSLRGTREIRQDRLNQMNKEFETLLKEVRSIDQAQALDQKVSDMHIQQLRDLKETLSLPGIIADARERSVGMAITTRRQMARAFIGNMVHAGHDIFARKYGKGYTFFRRQGPEEMSQMAGFALNSPDLFDVTRPALRERDAFGRFRKARGGTIRLKKEVPNPSNKDEMIPVDANNADFKNAFPLFAHKMKRWKKGKEGRAMILRQMEDVGFDDEAVRMIDTMRDMYEDVGQNLLTEGEVKQLIVDYLPRVVRFKRGILARKGVATKRQLVANLIADNTTEIGKLLRFSRGLGGSTSRLSVFEARVLTEKAISELLDKKVIEDMDFDAFNLMGEFLDQAHERIMWGTIIEELPHEMGWMASADPVARNFLKARGFTDQQIAETPILRPMQHKAEMKFGAGTSQASADRWVRSQRNYPPPRNQQLVYNPLGHAKRLNVEHIERPVKEAALPSAQSANIFEKPAVDEAVEALTQTGRFASDKNPSAAPKFGFSVKKSMRGKSTPDAHRKGKLKDKYYPTVKEIRKWISEGSVPEFIEAPKNARNIIQKRISDIEERMAFDFAGDVKSYEGPRAIERGAYVLQPFHDDFQELFRLYEADAPSSMFMQQFQDIANKAKSIVLSVDFFHQGVLGFMQWNQLGPTGVLARLTDQNGKFLPGVIEGGGLRPFMSSLAGKAAFGGAVGATATTSFDGDPGAVASGSLAGMIWGAAIGLARFNGAQAKKYFYSRDGLRALKYYGLGGATGRPVERSIGAVNSFLRRGAEHLRSKNFDGFADQMDMVRHLEGGFSRNLWEYVHEGSKYLHFQTLFDRQEAILRGTKAWAKLNPAAQEAKLVEVATEIVQSGNLAYGGQNFRALVAHPQMTRAMNFVFLSRDWTFGRAAAVASIFANMHPASRALAGSAIGTSLEYWEHGFDPDEIPWRGPLLGAAGGLLGGKWGDKIIERLGVKGDVLTKQTRKAYASAMLSMFFFGNLMNKAFTGRWMWENPEGHKTDVALPGKDVRGRESFMHFGKAYREFWELFSTHEADKYPIPIISRSASKASVPIRMTLQIATNHTGFGPVVTVDEGPAEFAGKWAQFFIGNLTPIVGQAPGRAALQLFNEEGKRTVRGGEALIRPFGVPVRKGRRRFTGLDLEKAGIIPPPRVFGSPAFRGKQ